MIQTASISDQGLRENLEDACSTLVFTRQAPSNREVGLGGVADGVGGNLFGEICSVLGLNSVMSHCTSILTQEDWNSGRIDPAVLLRDALEVANRAILARVAACPKMHGMATTAVVALLMDDALHVASLGDSRCYVCGPEKIRRVTRDHSKVQEMIDAGLLSLKEAQCHPSAHVINRFLGHSGPLDADVRSCRLVAGDMVILCTDGLTDVLTDEDILDWVQRYRDGQMTLQELPRRLASDALQMGSSDNVTVSCCEYHSPVIRHAPCSRRMTLTDAYAVNFAKALTSLKETANA